MGPSSAAETVKVVVRCRPLDEKEVAEGHTRIVDVYPQRGLIEIRAPSSETSNPARSFTFDAVYYWDSKQEDLYAETVKPLVESVLEGYNGTVFAYGQTGTGKTYTMEGVRHDSEKRGIIPRSFEQIFNHISCSRDEQFLVRASYLEIYQEQIRDLLAKDQKKRLELRERSDTGVYVKDLSSFVCKSVKEIEHVMNVGNQNRSVGATNMNEHSSRSHAIFIVTVESCKIGLDGENHIRVGRLNLVDLAGSERQNKTGAMGERLKEATKINLSLSALGNVISALVDGKNTHIPYRDSKLTRLLQDSLGGNSRTVMIATVGPASYNYEETVTTLRYASRAKHIRNRPQINEDPKDALLREFQEEIARLKANLANKKEKNKKKRSSMTVDEEMEKDWGEQEALLEEERRKLMQNSSMITEERDKLLQAVQEKEDEIRRQRESQQKLQARIAALESKLLKGSQETNMEDLTREQQGAIEKHRREILERQKLEREMQQKLEAQDEETLDLRETFCNLQQEADIKTRKLKKLYNKWQSVKQEMSDLAEEFRRERQQLEEAQEFLMKELRYKQMIIANFVPPHFQRKVLARMNYDEEEEAWTLDAAGSLPILDPPIADPLEVRPTSEYEKMARAEEGYNTTRYRGENIILLSLDPPQRTTQDYVRPEISPSLQSAIAEALKPDHDDVEIKAPAKRVSDIHTFLKSACTRKAAQRLRSHSKKPLGSPLKSKRHPQSFTPDGTALTAYPKSRGLIPK